MSTTDTNGRNGMPTRDAQYNDYQIITGNGDDPLTDDVGMELEEDERVGAVQDEIERIRESIDGDAQ